MTHSDMGKVTVLNTRREPDWPMRAKALGMDITKRPSCLGDAIYLIARGGAGIGLAQNAQADRHLDTNGFDAAQLSIVADLKHCGLIATTT